MKRPDSVAPRAGWRAALGVACLVTVLGSVSRARAEGDDRAVAEALFDKGRGALKRGDLDAACAAFEESERLEPAPGTMFNLGDCEEKRGHIAVAWQWFEEATQKLPATDKRHALVVARASALKARVPELTLRLAPGAPSDSTVLRDATELRSGSLGVALPIDPGTHRIVVTAPGHDERRFTIDLAEGEKKELVVEPGQAQAAPPPAPPAPLAPPPPPAPLAPPPSPAPPVTPPPSKGEPVGSTSTWGGLDKRTTGYIVGGIGVAGVGTALVLGAVAIGKKSTVDERCNAQTHTCTDQTGVDAASSGATLSTVSTVTFIVGAAAIGVGAYLILTDDGGGKKTAVAAAVEAGGAAIKVVGAF